MIIHGGLDHSWTKNTDFFWVHIWTKLVKNCLNTFSFNKVISVAVLPGFRVRFNAQAFMRKTIYEGELAKVEVSRKLAC